MSATAAGPAGYRGGMDMSPAWLILGVVVAAFIVLGLVWAFVADRRRNEEVAHDTERFEPDPMEPTDPLDPRHRRDNP
ncbi:hypothetical protein GCM10009788_53870 [Nocardioides humi]|uniref:Cbb3-type cytochrome c oxidase subunit 3 n=2 Tax=Nocardioides humi TaxID=449461 RepID=A0ABN2BRD4_9ACTN